VNVSFWELARAVRGPIMLVTFGVLMALNHTEKIGFERSWPVLIIVYGLLKLAERALGRPLPQPYPAPGYAPPQYPQHYPPAQNPPQGGTQ
jgi:hypothetical protein